MFCTFQVISSRAAENMTDILVKEAEVLDDVDQIAGTGAQLLFLTANLIGAAINLAEESSDAPPEEVIQRIAYKELSFNHEGDLTAILISSQLLPITVQIKHGRQN